MPGYGLLTKGGTVIDGVRLPRHRADSRVAGATIVRTGAPTRPTAAERSRTVRRLTFS